MDPQAARRRSLGGPAASNLLEPPAKKPNINKHFLANTIRRYELTSGALFLTAAQIDSPVGEHRASSTHPTPIPRTHPLIRTASRRTTGGRRRRTAGGRTSNKRRWRRRRRRGAEATKLETGAVVAMATEGGVPARARARGVGPAAEARSGRGVALPHRRTQVGTTGIDPFHHHRRPASCARAASRSRSRWRSGIGGSGAWLCPRHGRLLLPLTGGATLLLLLLHVRPPHRRRHHHHHHRRPLRPRRWKVVESGRGREGRAVARGKGRRKSGVRTRGRPRRRKRSATAPSTSERVASKTILKRKVRIQRERAPGFCWSSFVMVQIFFPASAFWQGHLHAMSRQACALL